MDLAARERTLASLRREARFFRLLTLGLVVVLGVLSAAIGMKSFEPERVVVVPPRVHTSFWVEQETVSPSYYQEWGYYMVMLLLNVTPESVARQNEILLRHVSTRYRAEIRAQLAAAAERLQQEQLSTFFNVTDVRVDPTRSSVAFAGVLASYVEGRLIGTSDVAYMASFEVHNGTLHLHRLVQTDPAQMFQPLGGDASS